MLPRSSDALLLSASAAETIAASAASGAVPGGTTGRSKRSRPNSVMMVTTPAGWDLCQLQPVPAPAGTNAAGPLGRAEQHVRDLAPAQWPVGGIIDADFDGFLAFFAARFSLRVLACFFRSSL